MTAVTAATFRKNFPEFASVAAYPAGPVDFWLGVADAMLSRRFGSMRDYAMQLFAAHNLALEKAAQKTASKGGVPGANTGAVSQKSVGPGSISYDSQSAIEENAGNFNLTTFGTRFYQMLEIFNAGPVQVGVGCAPWWINMGAWPGPCPWPLPSGTGFSS